MLLVVLLILVVFVCGGVDVVVSDTTQIRSDIA
jgi:hypothetical protein